MNIIAQSIIVTNEEKKDEEQILKEIKSKEILKKINEEFQKENEEDEKLFNERCKNCYHKNIYINDKFLFTSQYLQKIYGKKWFKKYDFEEMSNDKKTARGKKICWLHILPRDKFAPKNSDRKGKIINYKLINEKNMNYYPLKRIFGVELFCKQTKKFYRKYILKE